MTCIITDAEVQRYIRHHAPFFALYLLYNTYNFIDLCTTTPVRLYSVRQVQLFIHCAVCPESVIIPVVLLHATFNPTTVFWELCNGIAHNFQDTMHESIIELADILFCSSAPK